MSPLQDQPSLSSRRTRKTRFVCVADTHNMSPYNGNFKVPKGDVLIHAGDMTKQGTYGELKKTVDWIERLIHDGVVERAIIIAGNHELTLDPPFYKSYGHNWHSNSPQDPQKCLSLFSLPSLHPSITFLNHSSSHIILTSPTGPGTHFTVFGSPYTPVHITKVNDLCSGSRWAFQYPRYPSDESEEIWSSVPDGTDVLITHGPPYSHLDGNNGCEALRMACWRVRPKVHVFGHLHDGRGAERVTWRDGKHVVGMEEGCACSHEIVEPGETSDIMEPNASVEQADNQDEKQKTKENIEFYAHDHGQMEWIDPGAVDQRISGKMSLIDVTARTRMFDRVGLREGETVMINAAMVRGSWPYRGVGKAIVLDIDLEVWDEGEQQEEHGEIGPPVPEKDEMQQSVAE